MSSQVELGGSGDPCFATDADGHIIGWNRAAESLLGHAISDVLGRPCHQVIRGRDIFANRFCQEDCNLYQMIRQKEPIHGFLIDLRTQSGRFIRVGYSVTIVQTPRDPRGEFIHRLEPRGGSIFYAKSEESRPADLPENEDSNAMQAELTLREIEVLCLLAAGRGTREVARCLGVSVTTVRSHVQNILGKLQVHSRLEAVALARHKNLI